MNTTQTNGWLPTHDGMRTNVGNVRDPFIKNNGASGPIAAYIPWFASKGDANSWCRKSGAVPIACELSEAVRIANAHGAELVEA